MNTRLSPTVQLYTEYIAKDDKAKLHAGELLAEAARLLLDMNNEFLGNNTELHRIHLMQHIAMDIHKLVIYMAHTREFDCSPLLYEYDILAYKLMFECCERKANRDLLPYINAILSYSYTKKEPESHKKLKKLFKDSLMLEQRYLSILQSKKY